METSYFIEGLAMAGAAYIVSFGIMFVAWVIYVFRRKANIVDVGWAAAFIATAWAYLFIGNGYAPKRWVIALMVTIWAARLGKYMADRYFSLSEDIRYTDMRDKWGGDSGNILFLMMFLFQGFLVVLLSLPFFIVSFRSTSMWSGWELSGFLVWALGLAGESLADLQLSRFKADEANNGKVCEVGLWYYSRHPNYFFEWIVWIGFFVFAFASPGGWVAVVSPIIMFGMLTLGSGIPLNEAAALRSKGDAYRVYQRTTQPFFPWFPKKET